MWDQEKYELEMLGTFQLRARAIKEGIHEKLVLKSTDAEVVQLILDRRAMPIKAAKSKMFTVEDPPPTAELMRENKLLREVLAQAMACGAIQFPQIKARR